MNCYFCAQRHPGGTDFGNTRAYGVCRQCGQPTCFTFALKLAAGQQKLEDCPPLLEGEFAGQLAQLQAMVIVDAPGIG